MKISFAHNVQNRHRTLRETIEMEMKCFPEAKIYVAYNEVSFNLGYFSDLKNINFINYVGNGHKVGCVNGCIVSIKETFHDDSDIIVFSHDDVKINPAYIQVFNERINEIKEDKFDVICRQPHSFGTNYYMMEGLFIRKATARKIFELEILYGDENELPLDIRNSPSPEVWLYNVINKANVKTKCIRYLHSNNDYNKILAENLGLFHKNAGIRGWKD